MTFAGVNNGTSGIFSTVESTGVGKGGNIDIQASSLSVTDGAELTTNTFGQGNAGNVSIRARDAVTFAGVNNNGNSGIFSTVESTGVGKGGNIDIQASSLSVTDGAQLLASTYGQGNAGNVIINAPKSVSFNGRYTNSNGNFFPSGILSTVGDVYSTQNNLAIGNGGNIQITTDQLSLTNGAQLLASTYGQGNAGNVIINAIKSISLDGNRTAFFSTAGSRGLSPQRNSIAQGKGGNIQIKSSELSLTNGAQLNASTFGQSDAGNIEIGVRSIRLDQGSITATTNSGNGGNIKLTAQDYILLGNNSLISTTAGTASSGGNGGNITISTPFVIALPLENSDITANAFSGSGGRVSINATNLFNIAPLSRQNLERLRPQDLDPRQLPTNDITAVSQQNPDLSGTVQINTPDIDPNRGLVTLPTITAQTPKLVSSSCAAFADVGGSNFTVTGRSGLPPSPDEPLTSDVVWTDTRLPVTTEQHQQKTHASKPKPQPIAIIPATGWVLNDKGEVTLISSVSNATTLNTPTNCPAR